jgi:hypothetical protein
MVCVVDWLQKDEHDDDDDDNHNDNKAVVVVVLVDFCLLYRLRWAQWYTALLQLVLVE